MQAQAEVAQRRETLIRARTGDDDAEDRLRRLIMDPADVSFWTVRVDPVDEPAACYAMPDVDGTITKAVGGRIDVARATLACLR